MQTLVLSKQEIDRVETLLAVTMRKYKNERSEEFFEELRYLVYQMPKRLCKFLEDFKYKELDDGACIISGIPVNESLIGETPSRAKENLMDNNTCREDTLFCLLSTLLGEPFGWATQQHGRLIHDIVPVKTHENEQISTGSKQMITLHCEDAFHEYRADYVGLMCLRNNGQVGTTYSRLKLSDFSERQRKLLFHQKYLIRPDNSHLQINNEDGQLEPELLERSYKKIKRDLQQGIPIALLFGDFKNPYLRLDPYFMEEPIEQDYRDAYHALCRSLEKNTLDIVLHPGEVLFVDNYRAVHGRRAFNAKFDGRDRWLKRVNITRDLRRSRDARVSSRSRIIY